GSLAPDVRIGSWVRPWNEKPPEQRRPPRPAPPPKRHPYYLWATRPERFSEIGCIYSAQGFEARATSWVRVLRKCRFHGSWIVEHLEIVFTRSMPRPHTLRLLRHQSIDPMDVAKTSVTSELSRECHFVNGRTFGGS